MSFATRTYLSHTVFWHVLENNSVNQGCFEFWSKYASGNIEGNFPNSSTLRRPTRRGGWLRNQGRKFHEQSNVNRVRDLVRTVKLSFSERILKVGPLISKLMSRSYIAYLSEKCRIIRASLRNMWHLGMLSSGLQFETRAFRIWSKLETQWSPTMGQSGWKCVRPITSGFEKVPKTFRIFAALKTLRFEKKIWIQRQFSLEWKRLTPQAGLVRT